MAVTIATAVSALGVVSSIGGCVTAAENLTKGIDQYRNASSLSALLVDQIEASCAIIIEPSRHEYMKVPAIDNAADKLIKAAEAAKQWLQRFHHYSRARKFYNSEIYEKRFHSHLLAVQTYTTCFIQLCVAHSLRTPTASSTSSDLSDGFRVDLVDIHSS